MFWRKKKNKRETTDSNNQSGEIIDNLQMEIAVRTDLGNIRKNNEDAVLVKKSNGEDERRSILLLVADGMGGHLAGEVASNLAKEIIGEQYFQQKKKNNSAEVLKQAFIRANHEIFQKASSSDQFKGMGTTCTALAVDGNRLFYAHAGDSRAYHYRNGRIKQITTDHTYVQELVNEGAITAEEADQHPQRNILTNAMGTKPELKVDAGQYPENLLPGDRLLICSDGLYDYFNSKELEKILSKEDLQNVADLLLAEAKRRGGHDNITLIVATAGSSDLINNSGKETREASVLKMTRDADVPFNLNDNDRKADI